MEMQLMSPLSYSTSEPWKMGNPDVPLDLHLRVLTGPVLCSDSGTKTRFYGYAVLQYKPA